MTGTISSCGNDSPLDLQSWIATHPLLCSICQSPNLLVVGHVQFGDNCLSIRCPDHMESHPPLADVLGVLAPIEIPLPAPLREPSAEDRTVYSDRQSKRDDDRWFRKRPARKSRLRPLSPIEISRADPGSNFCVVLKNALGSRAKYYVTLVGDVASSVLTSNRHEDWAADLALRYVAYTRRERRPISVEEAAFSAAFASAEVFH